MNIQKLFIKKVKRKKFFYTVGAGLASLMLLKSFPFNSVIKNKLMQNYNTDKVKVRINPLSVNRKKLGDRNG